MRIDEAHPDAVFHVAQNMRRADIVEMMAVSSATTEAELAAGLARSYGGHQDGYTAFDDKGPVAAGAMVMARPNVATLGFFATDRFPAIALPLTKFIVKRLFPRYRDAGVHRIECVSLGTYEAAHAWIRTLGLAQEAVLPGFGRNGETFLQFAWVSDAVRSAGS